MKTVVIPWNEQSGAARLGIEMSFWCRDQGLVREKDYDWMLHTAGKELHFRFYSHCESYATLFSLRWVGNEV